MDRALPTALPAALTAVWALLVAATLTTWSVGGVSVAVLVIAFVKVRLVGLYFMELRSAPIPLRLLFEGWVVVTCSVLIGLYLSG
jgi:Prokaryotic Cytochrome C oxidase subunit IV